MFPLPRRGRILEWRVKRAMRKSARVVTSLERIVGGGEEANSGKSAE